MQIRRCWISLLPLLASGGSSFSAAAAENTPLGQATRQALQGAVAAIVAGIQKARWSARVIERRCQATLEARSVFRCTRAMTPGTLDPIEWTYWQLMVRVA